LNGQSRRRPDPVTGLTWIELALVRADRLAATARAMLLTARARTLALLGRVEDTMRIVRSKAMSGMKLAALTLRAADPIEGTAVGHQALDDLTHLRERGWDKLAQEPGLFR
jgi:hypothetical protein